MAQRNGELKKRCWLAKQRLKMGYWESVKNEKTQGVEIGMSEPSVAANVLIRDRLKRDADIAVGSNAVVDEKMYQKVCAILDSDEVAINPIGQLIDADVYNSLDPTAKQRYVLELSNKFRELKDRYYRERTGA